MTEASNNPVHAGQTMYDVNGEAAQRTLADAYDLAQQGIPESMNGTLTALVARGLAQQCVQAGGVKDAPRLEAFIFWGVALTSISQTDTTGIVAALKNPSR